MKRRVLLRGALGLPMVARAGWGSNESIRLSAAEKAGVLFSGLAGLDHAMGSVVAGDLACVTSPPHSGKTLVLLDWAARICGRYGKNVVFFSANEPSFGIARKAVAKGRARVFFARETQNFIPYTREIGSAGAIIMVDAHSGDLEQAQALATWLKANHSGGCAALVSDGWCTTRQRPPEVRIVDGTVASPAERSAPTFLPAEKLREAAEFARLSGLPVIMGVQTASLVDDDALADSLHLSLQLRLAAHRWVAMYRPELYVDSDRAVPADRNVVHLCGRSANWWDTRRSRLRFDDRQREFETVV
jgi:DnaB-like helicase C terminal domain